MPAFRVLRYLLLVLALVAGGVAPGYAQDRHDAEPVAAQGSCHGMDGELMAAQPSLEQPADCCEGADCRCDCLQHAPAAIVALRPPQPVQHARHGVEPVTASHAPAPSGPATRPPIA